MNRSDTRFIPVLVDGVRTPFCRSNNRLHQLSSFDLGSSVISALLGQSDIEKVSPEHVIMGTVIHNPPTPNIARECSLAAGVDVRTPAHTVSLACISSNVA